MLIVFSIVVIMEITIEVLKYAAYLCKWLSCATAKEGLVAWVGSYQKILTALHPMITSATNFNTI
jgi:hypothetical protein